MTVAKSPPGARNTGTSPTTASATKLESRAASVEFRNVSKIYGGSVRAVDNVSVTVEAGELVTLLGPSGCGKTTTLRMIAGLEMASSGSIYIGNTDVTNVPATERDVSMVFQSYALFPHMNVFDNVAYGLKVSRVPKRDIPPRVQQGLDLVGLAGYDQRYPSELSGGQQQRVAVARALVLEPQVLLFDEPLSNLDAKLRRQVREEIRDIQTSLGLTVVYVTHDQEEALAVSDRIIVMNNAVIAQAGTPRELYEQPESVFVADFIGEANIIDVVVQSVTDEIAEVQLGESTLQLASRGSTTGPAKLAVRPSRINLLPIDQSAVSTSAHKSPDQGTLAGEINKSTYVGGHMEYLVSTSHGKLFCVSTNVHSTFRAGQQVAVGFALHGPVLLPSSDPG